MFLQMNLLIIITKIESATQQSLLIHCGKAHHYLKN